MKQLPTYGMEPVDCGSLTLDAPQIAAIEKSVLDMQVCVCVWWCVMHGLHVCVGYVCVCVYMGYMCVCMGYVCVCVMHGYVCVCMGYMYVCVCDAWLHVCVTWVTCGLRVCMCVWVTCVCV